MSLVWLGKAVSQIYLISYSKTLPGCSAFFAKATHWQAAPGLHTNSYFPRDHYMRLKLKTDIPAYCPRGW